MPADQFDVVVHGAGIHLQRWGSRTAPLLVIGLPGLSGTSERFAFLGERIASERVQLIALDPRGRGRSETTPPGSYGWENHARDVLALADALGFDRFVTVGQSMGGSVAMKTAELDGRRLRAVVLVDIAGRVDPGVGAVIASALSRLDEKYESVDAYLRAVRADGLTEPWDDYWEQAYRADMFEVDSHLVRRSSREAIAEDRAYTLTQDPYDRWKHLEMPTLLLRATRELRPGCGFVVPADDRDRFDRAVAAATIVEVDANHLTINTSAQMAAAVDDFLAGVMAS
jgi:pimeloyl-ACP methyl ester carboxylesterase